MVGASWKTALVGYVIITLDVLNLIGDAIKKDGLPTDIQSWIVFAAGLATGVGLILAKDFNVSNSQHPAVARVVPLVAEATPNPSAVPKRL